MWSSFNLIFCKMHKFTWHRRHNKVILWIQTQTARTADSARYFSDHVNLIMTGCLTQYHLFISLSVELQEIQLTDKDYKTAHHSLCMVSNPHTRQTRLQTYSTNLNSFMYYLTGITNTLFLQVLSQCGIWMLTLFLEFKWSLYLVQTSVAYQCREAISCKYLNQTEHAQY